MFVPRVGTTVEFRPGNKDGLSSKKEDQWLATIVCFVFEGQDRGIVNLRVFDENGNGYPRVRVIVIQPGVVVIQPGTKVAIGGVLAEAGYCRLMKCPPVMVTGNAADAAKLRNAADVEWVGCDQQGVVKPKALTAAEKKAAKEASQTT